MTRRANESRETNDIASWLSGRLVLVPLSCFGLVPWAFDRQLTFFWSASLILPKRWECRPTRYSATGILTALRARRRPLVVAQISCMATKPNARGQSLHRERVQYDHRPYVLHPAKSQGPKTIRGLLNSHVYVQTSYKSYHIYRERKKCLQLVVPHSRDCE